MQSFFAQGSWAVRSAGDRILERSCGDGVFLEAAAERLIELVKKDRIETNLEFNNYDVGMEGSREVIL